MSTCLAEEFTVIAGDLRGHDESNKYTGPAFYTTEKMGQDTLAVADTCGFERFNLCGFSYGGNVGCYLAARSDRISKMVMHGNKLGTGVSGDFHQFVFNFRDRWKLVIANAGDIFNPKLLSAKDQEDMRKLSYWDNLVKAIQAYAILLVEHLSIICM